VRALALVTVFGSPRLRINVRSICYACFIELTITHRGSELIV